MSESNPAEKFLKEHGLIQRSSEQRQQLLGCLGCRFNQTVADGDKPVAYGYQIMKCTGMKSGVVYPLLKKLEEAGVISSRQEEAIPEAEGRPLRRIFAPAGTELGQEFARTLEPPATCRLEMNSSRFSNPA